MSPLEELLLGLNHSSNSNLIMGRDGFILHDINPNRISFIKNALHSEEILSTEAIRILSSEDEVSYFISESVTRFLNESQDPDFISPDTISVYIPTSSLESDLRDSYKATYWNKTRNNAHHPETVRAELKSDREALRLLEELDKSHGPSEKSTKTTSSGNDASLNNLPSIDRVRRNTLDLAENVLKNPRNFPHIDNATKSEIKDYAKILAGTSNSIDQRRYIEQLRILSRHGRVSKEYLKLFLPKATGRYVLAGQEYENSAAILSFIFVAAIVAIRFVPQASLVTGVAFVLATAARSSSAKIPLDELLSFTTGTQPLLLPSTFSRSRQQKYWKSPTDKKVTIDKLVDIRELLEWAAKQ